MSFNGSGTFLINTAGQPVVSGTTITSTAFNLLTGDLATGLSNTITRDGQSTPTANLPMGSFKFTGLAVATGSGQALTYGQNGNFADLTVTGTFTAAVALSGLLTATAGVVSASDTLARKITFNGSSSVAAQSLLNAIEKFTPVASAATGTIALYPSTQSILWWNLSASANWTVNLTFSAGTTYNTALATGESMTTVFMATQGATPKYNNVVQVDGTAVGVTTIWQNGAPTAGNASGVDVYSYVVLKTGSATFTVLASVAQFR